MWTLIDLGASPEMAAAGISSTDRVLDVKVSSPDINISLAKTPK